MLLMIPSREFITNGLPTGWKGFWMALTNAVLREDITSFMVEVSVSILSHITIVLL